MVYRTFRCGFKVWTIQIRIVSFYLKNPACEHLLEHVHLLFCKAVLQMNVFFFCFFFNVIFFCVDFSIPFRKKGLIVYEAFTFQLWTQTVFTGLLVLEQQFRQTHCPRLLDANTITILLSEQHWSVCGDYFIAMFSYWSPSRTHFRCKFILTAHKSHIGVKSALSALHRH